MSLTSRGSNRRGEAGSLQNLGDQRAYTHVECERARVASSPTHDREAARLVAA
jgi:hypothetical protein